MTSSRKTIAAVLLFCVALAAQQAKRALTHKDYDAWRTIGVPRLSNDGKWLAYALMPQEGDGDVVVRNLATGKEQREPIGARPQAPPRDPDAEPQAGPPTPPGPRLAFTADSRTLVVSTFPNKADVDQAKKEKKRPEEMPKGGLLIMDLEAGKTARIERVKNFQVPEKGNGFIAYAKEAPPGSRPAERSEPSTANNEDDDADQRGQGQRGGGQRPGGAGDTAAPRKEYGTELVLRKLADGSERTFADALEYSLSKDAAALVYTVSSRKEESNGVFTVATGDGAEPTALLNGKGKYSKLSWDLRQKRLAFYSDRDDAAAKQPKVKLYGWERGSAQAAEWVTNGTPGLHKGFIVSERAALRFSRDGSLLFLGSAVPPEPEKDPAKQIPDDEKVVVDLWHWKDDNVQPMQRSRANQDRNRTYQAVWSVAEKRLVQLADPTLPQLSASDNSRWAIGQDDREYRPLVEYDQRYADQYLVDTSTGSRKLLAKKQAGGLSWSPDSKYALKFEDGHWHSVSIPDGATRNLTANLGVAFLNEDHDSPSKPGAYGTGGFTKDGRWALLYDRFDVWVVAPDGSAAKNLTAGYGRKNQIRFRAIRLGLEDDEEEEEGRGFDPAKPLYLRAENLENRDTGYFRTRFDSTAAPEKLVIGARNFGVPIKARNADVVVVTQSTFSEFPDLHQTDLSFKQFKKVTNAGAQKSAFIWGASELINYRNADGVPLKAALYKPENFDPQKKYPLMVYIYERLSQGLHNFVNPQPGTSINKTFYVSNGYLVLEPDIIYTVGYPGPSALKCVLPAIQAVVDRGIVNENAIGIQGHSWGGYQIAYMITQTHRFRAVAAGAPVSNMISAYDGIRWGPGLPRQFQYEKTQSRIGGTLWDYPLRFIDNSPIFRADKVKTPLLMLHNDQDDAVPWYQGIEYFLALRRLGKEVYMFNYNGEPHGIRKRQNQKDYTLRMQQFFDHYLKGAPKPEWMERGIPFLEREKEKEKYRTESDDRN
jgi:dipeptidyl aminopeptidase/acylaminoacyl peptidase